MRVQQEYNRLNESIHPSAELLVSTLERMQAESTAEKIAQRARRDRMKAIGRYASVAVCAALLCFAVMKVPAWFGAKAADSAASPMEGIVEMEDMDAADSVMPEANYMVEENAAGTGAAEAAADETAEEFADIAVYYVEDGQLKARSEYLPCTVEDVFAMWAQINGITDVEVLSVSVQSDDILGVQIDFSSNLIQQLDAQGNLAAALTMTLAEYLNADGIVLTSGGQAL